MIVWECSLSGKLGLPPGEVAARARAWLNGDESEGEVSGDKPIGSRRAG